MEENLNCENLNAAKRRDEIEFFLEFLNLYMNSKTYSNIILDNKIFTKVNRNLVTPQNC